MWTNRALHPWLSNDGYGPVSSQHSARHAGAGWGLSSSSSSASSYQQPSSFKLERTQPSGQGTVHSEVKGKTGKTSRGLPSFTGVYVDGLVQGVQVTFTIDTGATTTILSSKIYKKIPEEQRPRIRKNIANFHDLVGAGGNSLNFQGRGTFEIYLGPLRLEKELSVAEISDEVLLGADTLQHDEHGPVDLILSLNLMICRGISIPEPFDKKRCMAYSPHSRLSWCTGRLHLILDLRHHLCLQQIPVREEDIPKTAFVTRYGLFEFTTTPFGLTGASATFQRLMEIALSGLQWSACLIYLDDVIIFSQTFDKHLERIRLVLDRIAEAGLKLKPRMCHLFAKEVTFLGHKLSSHGVLPNPDNVQKLLDWPVPRTVTEVRGFLGLGNYYRRFVRNFSQTAQPLINRTKKGNDFHWSPACQEAFNELKRTLCSPEVMAYPSSESWLQCSRASAFFWATIMPSSLSSKVAYSDRKEAPTSGFSMMVVAKVFPECPLVTWPLAVSLLANFLSHLQQLYGAGPLSGSTAVVEWTLASPVPLMPSCYWN